MSFLCVYSRVVLVGTLVGFRCLLFDCFIGLLKLFFVLEVWWWFMFLFGVPEFVVLPVLIAFVGFPCLF